MRYPLAALALACLLAGCATGSTDPVRSSSVAPSTEEFTPLAESTSAAPTSSAAPSTSASRTTVAPKPATTTAAPTTSAAPAATVPATSSAAARTSAAPKPASTTAVAPKPAPKPAATTATAAATTTPYVPLVARKYGTGNATQLITVTSHGASNTTAVLSAWRKVAGRGWVKVAGFDGLTAYVGGSGVGKASEYIDRTPAGSFTLTFAFGNQSNPGTRLPYHHDTKYDWWVGDSASRYYNQLRTCPTSNEYCYGPPSEHLTAVGSLYNHAVLIDYNTPNSPTGVVKHAGSAFFLHVTNYKPTGGCVAIPQSKLDPLMRWLNPAAHPRIVIGVV